MPEVHFDTKEHNQRKCSRNSLVATTTPKVLSATLWSERQKQSR
jgi:hypothetical protein